MSIQICSICIMFKRWPWWTTFARFAIESIVDIITFSFVSIPWRCFCGGFWLMVLCAAIRADCHLFPSRLHCPLGAVKLRTVRAQVLASTSVCALARKVSLTCGLKISQCIRRALVSTAKCDTIAYAVLILCLGFLFIMCLPVVLTWTDTICKPAIIVIRGDCNSNQQTAS